MNKTFKNILSSIKEEKAKVPVWQLNKCLTNINVYLDKYNQDFTIVGELNNILFINCGNTTSVNQTVSCLQKIKHPVILIIGGLNSLDDYSPLTQLASENIDTIITIGIGKETLAKKFETYDVEVITANTTEEAVFLAYKSAKENYVVLFSPSAPEIEYNNTTTLSEEQFTNAVKKLIA
jgi:UDP-N-acetylmuramoylalanine-D-glutamate ligase